MKTTVEIADALLEEAKRIAKERDITLRELIECGLRKELKDRSSPREKFVWKDLSYGGGGLREPFTWDNWAAIKEFARQRGDDDDSS